MIHKVNRDSNHAEIVNQLTQHNISVLDLAMVGGGCPDILIGFKTTTGSSVNLLVELKSSGKAKVRPIQEEFIRDWQGLTTVCWDAKSILHICNYHGLKI